MPDDNENLFRLFKSGPTPEEKENIRRNLESVAKAIGLHGHAPEGGVMTQILEELKALNQTLSALASDISAIACHDKFGAGFRHP